MDTEWASQRMTQGMLGGREAHHTASMARKCEKRCSL